MDEMTGFERDGVRKALRDMLDRSTAAVAKFAPGTSQHTLQSRRIAALNVAMDLLSDGGSAASEAELTMAATALSSLLSKSEKALTKVKPASWQHAMLASNVAALRIALEWVREAGSTAERR